MDENEFDNFMLDLRKKQIEAIGQCYRWDLLAAKILFKDRMNRMNYLKIKGVARNPNNVVAEIMCGLQPIVFMEN